MKKSRGKNFVENIIALVFIFSIILWLGSVILLRSHNVVLANKEASQSNEIKQLKSDISRLEVAVEKLDDKERILKVAKKYGLKVNQENIVSVK